MTNTESDLVDRVIEAAERRLKDAAGDQSLCAIGRSGRSYPAVKYHEGAVATLVSVRSKLKAGTTLAGALDAARSGLARLGHLAQQSPDWAAYQAGGLEAIEGITDSSESSSA